MGRPRRIQFPGACSYVVLSGTARRDLFLSNQDRRQFLSLLRAAKERHGLKIYAYSLLDGRVDLLVETPAGDLAAVMQAFNTRYTKYFGGAHNAAGPVFAGRYRSWVVEKETRLAEMTRYVHLACVRGALKDKPWRYQWTSCAAYVEAEHKEPLVDSAAVLRKFGGTRLKQSVRYLQYVKDRLHDGGGAAPSVLGGAVIGSAAFLHKWTSARGAPAAPRPASAADARRIIAEVCARRGVTEESLLGRVQWREVTAARREAVHRAWKEARLGVSALARLFSRTPGAVSQMIRAVEDVTG